MGRIAEERDLVWRFEIIIRMSARCVGDELGRYLSNAVVAVLMELAFNVGGCSGAL
jgi:hypothetical protein